MPRVRNVSIYLDFLGQAQKSCPHWGTALASDHPSQRKTDYVLHRYAQKLHFYAQDRNWKENRVCQQHGHDMQSAYSKDTQLGTKSQRYKAKQVSEGKKYVRCSSCDHLFFFCTVPRSIKYDFSYWYDKHRKSFDGLRGEFLFLNIRLLCYHARNTELYIT